MQDITNKSLNDNIKVSAIVTTYNRLEEAKRAIESVINQNYRHIEIIIVEDGSNSGIEAWLDTTKTDNTRYVRLDHNRGLAVARNTGLKFATGELIAYLDDDDEWKPDRIKKQVEAYNKVAFSDKDRLGVIYCGAEIRFPGKKSVSIKHPKRVGDIRKIIVNEGMVTIASSYLFIKKAIEDVGRFDENLSSCIDHDIWMALASRGYTAIAVDKPLVIVYDRTNRTTMMTNTKGRMKGVKQYVNKWKPTFYEWFGKVNGDKYICRYHSRVLSRLIANKLVSGDIEESWMITKEVFSFGKCFAYKIFVLGKYSLISLIEKVLPDKVQDLIRKTLNYCIRVIRAYKKLWGKFGAVSNEDN